MGETELGKKRKSGSRDNKPNTTNILQLKTRKLNPVNTTSFLQILGTGMDTQDTSPSVLLFFDKQRFIFNAGEGLQRYCTEHKIKLSKIDHIFLSRVCSETAGGLPGLLLTMAGIGDKGMCVKIWGPPGLDYLVNAMDTFIPSAAMVHTKSFGPTLQPDGITIPDPKKFSGPFDLVDDEVVKISAILLHPNENNGSASIKPCDISVIYVCELPKIQGKFHPEKAKALGLKPGPKYRDLQNDISVKSDNLDIMVHPRDVMDPPVPGPVVILVDCPTTSHLQCLLSLDSLKVYYKDYSDNNIAETSKEVNCVIHLSPSSVSNNCAYKEWMTRFGNAQHIMAGHAEKNAEIPVLRASARISARLNYLCPWLFPASGFCSPHINNSSTEGAQHIISAENLLKFNLRPHATLGLDRSSIPIATRPVEIVEALRADIPEIEDAVQQVKQMWDRQVNDKADASSQNIVEDPRLDDERPLPSCLKDITREDMEIVLLGTGSSQPSKYRNVSSIYINLFSKGGFLFDCGEGTLGQLKRRYGVKDADDVVRSLSCIWISHIHADHHTGLSRILALRRDLLKDDPHDPLLVIGPGQLLRFLNAYERLEKLDMQFLDCKFTTRSHCYDQPRHLPVDSGYVNERLKMLRKVLQEAGLETLISFPVDHFWEAPGDTPQAYGVSLNAAQRSNKVGEMIPGWKIVYSGDTRPCLQLVEEARGATVLIHEATFEDDMESEAIGKKHSTTREAIDMGEKAGVYRIVLTHFSQRYPKIPVFGDSHMHNTCIGFDLMSINMADLRVFPQVLPHLKLLFRNEIGVDEVDEFPLEELTDAPS